MTVAHRTSPTNMGLALLANLAAYDFGYIPAGQLLLRTANAVGTMKAMERYEGHFYNWYDTQSLKPLPPLYVSAVDSGNLAGHLMTLRPGLAALADDRIMDRAMVRRLERHAADPRRSRWWSRSGAARPLAAGTGNRVRLAAGDNRRGSTVARPARRERRRSRRAGRRHSGRRFRRHAFAPGDAAFWVDALVRQCRILRDELAFLAPWTALPAAPGGFADLPGLGGIPTLRELAALEGELLPAIARRGAPTRRPRSARGSTSSAERRRREPSRHRADRGDRAPGDAMRRAGPHGVRLSLRRARHLLAIGYNVGERRRDPSYYDLLASEARFSSFVAIAQGQLPQENWFALGRLLTSAGGHRCCCRGAARCSST